MLSPPAGGGSCWWVGPGSSWAPCSPAAGGETELPEPPGHSAASSPALCTAGHPCPALLQPQKHTRSHSEGGKLIPGYNKHPCLNLSEKSTQTWVMSPSLEQHSIKTCYEKLHLWCCLQVLLFAVIWFNHILWDLCSYVLTTVANTEQQHFTWVTVGLYASN